MTSKVTSPCKVNEHSISMPYVVDNREHVLADALNDLLHSHSVHALDGLS